MPHPRTLAKWFAASNCHGNPGILVEAIKTLRSVGLKLQSDGKELIGSLSLDEIAGRRHVQYDHKTKRFVGFIHLGKRNTDGSLPVSNNFLVFMFTSLHSKVSIPVAYYAVKSLNAYEKRDLITEILTALHSIGAKVINMTFDGLKANVATCELLGASFNPKSLKPDFPHPVDNSDVCIMLDPCHALKLIRNALGDIGQIIDPQTGKVQWKHYEGLQTLKESSNFLTHKLNKKHIQYKRNKMNVRLAAQLFSDGTGKSMAHCKNIGIEEYQDSDASIKFTLNMNKTFDAMNSKHDRPGFKGALNASNSSEVFAHFDQMDTYIRKLKFKKKLCINSRRKTGFIGMLVNMMVIKRLYRENVLTGKLESLPTFYLSQDVLESFFSRIRSLLGSNDNPTHEQFKGAIRKLLFLNEVSSSEFANCEDSLDLLHVSSACSELDVTSAQQHNTEYEHSEEEESIIMELIREEELLRNDSNLLDATIAFLAASVETNIQIIFLKHLKCLDCDSIFTLDEKVPFSFVESSKTHKPCKSTFKICKVAHYFIDESMKTHSFDYKKIAESTMNILGDQYLFTQTLCDYVCDIVPAIIDRFIHTYSTYIAQKLTLNEQQLLLRNRNKRVTIFNGQ